MQKITCRLFVTFEEPFWVAVYEREEKGRFYAAKVTFGAQPKDGEVYQYFLENWHRLSFGPPLESKTAKEMRNPKRRQREAKKLLTKTGVGTKSQQAIARGRELQKQERRANHRKQRRKMQALQYQLRAQKKKEKKKGH